MEEVTLWAGASGVWWIEPAVAVVGLNVAIAVIVVAIAYPARASRGSAIRRSDRNRGCRSAVRGSRSSGAAPTERRRSRN